MKTQKCNKCGVIKPVEQFGFRDKKIEYLLTQCKSCVSVRQKQRRKNPVIKQKDNDSSKRYYRKPGVRERVLARCKRRAQLPDVKIAKSRYQKKYHRTPSGRYKTAIKNAQCRGRIFTLTPEQYLTIISINQCYYCDGSLSPTGIGLDRIENKGGYTPDNVVPCCSVCNETKHDNFTKEQMLEIKSWLIKCRKQREKIRFRKPVPTKASRPIGTKKGKRGYIRKEKHPIPIEE